MARPDDGRLVHEGHWSRTAEAAGTVNSGSRLRFRFTGSGVHVPFDVTSVTVSALTGIRGRLLAATRVGEKGVGVQRRRLHHP